METPSFKESYISQIPAVQLLIQLGYTYLSPQQAMELRGGKTSGVLLEGVLREQLQCINRIRFKGADHEFSPGNIQAGIQALKDLPMNEGYGIACQKAYDLMTSGKALEQSIDGDKKSFTLQYIDWKNPHNNVFHVTEEYSVMRSQSRDTYRPDIVLFINGIPLCIIECKSPAIKNPLHEAIAQHVRYQTDEGIRSIYKYSHLMLGIATSEASYATNNTKEEFWAQWKELFKNKDEEQAYTDTLEMLINSPIDEAQKAEMYSWRTGDVRDYFESIGIRKITEQDRYVYSLCRPERLLDIIFNFTLFDNGEKKIARYQQYFSVKKTMERIRTIHGGRRKGGVIWHTQGSGKSLTMVMLAQAISLDTAHIKNPKIILVTDRVDLDEQITDTFKKCTIAVLNAATGNQLIDYLKSKSDAVVTTVINKFEAAVRKIGEPLTSPDIFVLVDEGHRTQYGTFNVQMQKTLPNACFIAMTGTPLLKKEKSTAAKFGGIIDSYTVNQAVEDGAVVPILYEGRHATQEVKEKAIDTYFEQASKPLTVSEKTDLKKKYSQADHLNKAEQKINAIALDISKHFQDEWQGTGFKGQLVCPSKHTALQYKKYLDEIGIVTSEVIISPPDENEGDEDDGLNENLIQSFWKKRMDEHGNQKKYEQHTINRFKNQDTPEIIIVVDKLLTGFDAPRNVVLYITRSLREHTLLQAIARVNRVYPGKEYGYIIDYYGILGELDEALAVYSNFKEYDEKEIAGALTDINEKIKTLPQVHSELWALFKTILNKRDPEAYREFLRAEDKRTEFYEKLREFASVVKIALSSIRFHRETDEKLIQRYQGDLLFFMRLRSAVAQTYSDTIDYKEYEAQIQKLIDRHVLTDEVKVITEYVNIFDKEKFQQEVEKAVGVAAKADMIASRTNKTINEKMEEDPAFYKKFSQMLKETIQAYNEQRISEVEYLQKARAIMEAVLTRTDSEIPEDLQKHEIAQAYYGLCLQILDNSTKDTATRAQISTQIALAIDTIINRYILDGGKPIVDWQNKSGITGKLKIDIGDYLMDEIRDKHRFPLSFEQIDTITGRCLDVARVRYN